MPAELCALHVTDRQRLLVPAGRCQHDPHLVQAGVPSGIRRVAAVDGACSVVPHMLCVGMQLLGMLYGIPCPGICNKVGDHLNGVGLAAMGEVDGCNNAHVNAPSLLTGRSGPVTGVDEQVLSRIQFLRLRRRRMRTS